MATKSTTKSLSLIEQIQKDSPELFGGVQFSPEIFIPFPTRKACEQIADTKDEEAIARILLGDQADAIEEALSELPLGASIAALGALFVALREGMPDVEDAFRSAGVSEKDLQAYFAEALKTTE